MEQNKILKLHQAESYDSSRNITLLIHRWIDLSMIFAIIQTGLWLLLLPNNNKQHIK